MKPLSPELEPLVDASNAGSSLCSCSSSEIGPWKLSCSKNVVESNVVGRWWDGERGEGTMAMGSDAPLAVEPHAEVEAPSEWFADVDALDEWAVRRCVISAAFKRLRSQQCRSSRIVRELGDSIGSPPRPNYA